MRPTFAAACLLVFAPIAGGQEFRVHTVVTEHPAGGGKPVELARSLTLFHAGQAWDYAVEAREVVRFDPAAATFTVLDLNRDLACTVSLAEIDRQVKIGRQETEKYAAKLAADPSPSSAALAARLAFELAPRFEVKDAHLTGFPRGTRTLTCEAPDVPLTYTVLTAKPKTPSTATFYLDYADWTARLNYAMRPGPFPDVRVAVNAELRSRGLLPQAVTLSEAPVPGIVRVAAGRGVLRAEHTFEEKLAARDRELLAEWRGRLTGGTARAVTFREYLRLTTGAVAAR